MDLMTAPNVDLDRYVGLWFEIARKPMRHEGESDRNITAEYSLNDDGSLHVVNSCINKDMELERAIGTARAIDETNARFEVSFMPDGLQWLPFTKGDYWILKVDPSHQVALVGEPSRKYLWLLSRDAKMAPETAEEWLSVARMQGYDLSDLIWPLHSPVIQQEGSL